MTNVVNKQLTNYIMESFLTNHDQKLKEIPD